MNNMSDVLEAYLIPAEEGIGTKLAIGAVATGVGLYGVGKFMMHHNSAVNSKNWAAFNTQCANVTDMILNNPTEKSILLKEIDFIKKAYAEYPVVYMKSYNRIKGDACDYILPYDSPSEMNGYKKISIEPEDLIRNIYLPVNKPDPFMHNELIVAFLDAADNIYYDNEAQDFNEEFYMEWVDYLGTKMLNPLQADVNRTKYLKELVSEVKVISTEDGHQLVLVLNKVRKNSPLSQIIEKYRYMVDNSKLN